MRRSPALVALSLLVATAIVALSLPATHASTPSQDAPQRIAVFETFGREECAICKAAAPSVDRIDADLGARVIVVEHDIDAPTGHRYQKWWNAKGAGGTVQTPLVLVDSGLLWTNGSEDFYRRYRRLMDEALMRPPEVDIKAYYEVLGSKSIRVVGTVQNISDITLGWDNSAEINIMIYEDTAVIHTQRFVRAGHAFFIEEDLEEGETYEFDTTLEDLPRFNASKMHVAVIVDYRPGGQVWQSLNAAIASDEVPPPPTETSVPMTDTPMPTFFIPPTDTPQPPTEEVSDDFAIYIPDVRRE